MRDLARAIPDVELLLALEPEELAGKLLFVLRKRIEAERRPVHLSNCLLEFDYGDQFGSQPIYPPMKLGEVKVAVSEAWLWLQAQGMIIPSTDGNGHQGFAILSRRARSFEDERQFGQYQESRLLPKEILHRRFADTVWPAFIRANTTALFFRR